MALPREISQRELRNDSGGVMRGLERGESFIVTRNGVPLATLAPLHGTHFTKAGIALQAFRSAPRVEYSRLRADLDAHVDQDAEPRA